MTNSVEAAALRQPAGDADSGHVGTRTAPSAALIVTVQKAGKPTVRQVYALAAALCERMGEEFPESRGAASELIERLRVENGHPAPRLEDAPLRS